MGQNLNIILIDSEENTRNIIKSYLSELENIQISSECIFEYSDIDEGIKKSFETQNSILLIDISENIEKALESIRKLKDEKKDTLIAALSYKATTDVIIKAMRAGAKEFISKPVIKTDFKETITALIQEIENKTVNESCKIISTFSNKGGIGKTSIAVNLAMELAQLSKEKVALVDLNLQLGDVATFLDLTPSFAMDYIANNIQNLDDNELLKTLTRYKNTSLYVIADPLNIDKSKEITSAQIEEILQSLKKSFSYIVIDIGTNIDSKTIKALDMSDLILLVATVNLPAIRSIQRCMEMFNKLGYTQDKIKLVLNRYMENEEIKTSDIEEVVKQKVYWKIPNNYLTMMSAINKGVPVNEINQESNIAQNYMDFASKVSDYLITQKLLKDYNKRENIRI